MRGIIELGDRPALSAQVLYEFWCVATRPAAANGLGWPASEAQRAIAGFRREFDILHDLPEVLDKAFQSTTNSVADTPARDPQILQVPGFTRSGPIHITISTEKLRGTGKSINTNE